MLSSEFLPQFTSWLDAALVSWWADWMRLPPGETHDTYKLFTRHFFAEVGLAFMVAGLIAIFVEFIFRIREEQERIAYVREDQLRHERHVSEDEARHQRQMDALQEGVFKHVLGTFAPPWLSDQVVDLYKTKVLRENLSVTYAFAGPPKSIERLGDHTKPSLDELLTVTVQIQYRLRNLTDQWADCEIEHGFEPTVPLPAPLSGFTSLMVSRVKDSGETYEALNWCEGETNEFVECVVPPDTDRLGWKSRTLGVKEQFLIDPKGVMDVVVCHRSVRWCYDHDTWVTRIPADGLKVIANLGNGSPVLDFSLERSHPKPFKQTAGPFRWRSDGPVLPFQGFTLHWFRKENASPPRVA